MGVFESSRTFFKFVPDLAPVAADVVEHFKNKGFEVASDQRVSGAWDISVTKSNFFKAVCGLRTALKIEIVPQGDSVFAKAGVGIFGQQVIPSIISMFLFWPVIIPQIWGIISQSKLDDEALRLIEDSINLHSRDTVQYSAPGVTAGAVTSNICCGNVVPQGSLYCPACGRRIV